MNGKVRDEDLTPAARDLLDSHLSRERGRILDLARTSALEGEVSARDVREAIDSIRPRPNGQRLRISRPTFVAIVTGGALLLLSGVAYLTIWRSYSLLELSPLIFAGLGVVTAIASFFWGAMNVNRRDSATASQEVMAIWNDLQSVVRQRASQGDSKNEPVPIPSVLNSLVRDGSLSSQEARQLQVVLRLRNRAAHGEVVSEAEAKEATELWGSLRERLAKD